jgi:WD40 repeat protein
LASGESFQLSGHESWITLAARARADLVLTADQTGVVIAWDCHGDRPEPRWRVVAHASSILSLAVDVEGDHFATGDRDGTIRLWRCGDGQRTGEIAGLEHPVYGLAYHPDGKHLFSADRQPRKPRWKRWEIDATRELLNVEVPALSAYRRVEDIEWGGIRSLTASPDGRTVVACGENDYSGPACAIEFDAETGMPLRKYSSPLKGFYYAALFQPAGCLTLVGGDIGKGECRFWKLATNTIAESKTAAESNSADGKSAANAESQAGAKANDAQGGAKPNAKAKDSAPPAPPAPQSVPLDTSVAIATAGPCTAMAVHPEGRRFLLAQTIGKGSYPDSGRLDLYEWLE